MQYQLRCHRCCGAPHDVSVRQRRLAQPTRSGTRLASAGMVAFGAGLVAAGGTADRRHPGVSDLLVAAAASQQAPRLSSTAQALIASAMWWESDCQDVLVPCGRGCYE